MAAYWITFRIAERTIGDRTYETRYNDLTETVRVNSSRWWTEPTSFIAFESDVDISSLATASKAAIAPTHDLFLIRMMDKQTAIICGKNDDQDVYKLMPYLKKL